MEEIHARIAVVMPWHEKVCAIEEEDRLAAFGLYTASVCFCQQNLTDGRIRNVDLARVFPSPDVSRIAGLLLAVNLFDEDGAGYRVHDYLEHNKSREQIEAEKDAKRTAGRKGGQASAIARAQAPASPPAQAKSNPTTYTDTTTDTDKTDTREGRSTFEECNNALVSAFGTFLPSAQVIKLKRLCDDYEGSEPSALERIMHGIEQAKREGKPKPAFAIGCASNAGAAEVKTTKKRTGPECRVCNDSGIVTDADGVESECIFCPSKNREEEIA